MNKLSVRDLDLRGKTALVRVDFNVPIRDGKVDDDNRLVAALPTIRYVLEQGAAAVLMSHLGRPKGHFRLEDSLAPVRDCLAKHLGMAVSFADDCVGPVAEAAAAKLEPGQVLLLENLRFHRGEEKPDQEPDFAEKLSRLGNCYINDAFGTAHRAHASMVALAERFDRRAAGFLMANEIEYFGTALSNPSRPFDAVLGGAKVSDKIPVLEHLIDRVDGMLVGGAMAYTFLAAQGVPVGDSRVELDMLDLSKIILAKAVAKAVEFFLPLDHLCGREFAEDTERMTTKGPEIPDGWMGLDIGPRTLERYRERLAASGTIVWNGPMGVFEWEAFSAGTFGVARAAAESRAVSIVGGGDSASAAAKAGLTERFSHISTGGGASLELLEGKLLPGLEALSDRAG